MPAPHTSSYGVPQGPPCGEGAVTREGAAAIHRLSCLDTSHQRHTDQSCHRGMPRSVRETVRTRLRGMSRRKRLRYQLSVLAGPHEQRLQGHGGSMLA